MADLIGLINDISTSVKLAWVGVLVWAAIQFVWYRRVRVLPGTSDAASSRVSLARQSPSVTRPPEADSVETSVPQVLGIAASLDLDVLADAELSSESDVLADFQEPGTRRRSTRRRRATGNSRNGVSELVLDTPKAT